MPHETLRNLTLKSHYQIYGDDDTPVLDAFYVPVLCVAQSYDRLAGFFSSCSLALAAKGIAALIANDGVIRMVCSPHLSPSDVEVMKKPEEYLKGKDIDVYFKENFSMSENDIKHDHVAALAWLLQAGRLKIKLAVVTDNYGCINSDLLFHPKIGIIRDHEGNEISFCGSNNETASGWTGNQEAFKVFKSWEDGQSQFVEDDKASFENYWNDRVHNVKCFDLPQAFKERLIRESRDFSCEEYVRKHYEARCQNRKAWQRLNLFDYQEEAVAKWLGNGRRLMFEMATGSGKTRCAIACMNKLIEIKQKQPICIVVAVPTNDLCAQWEEELRGAMVEDCKVVLANSRQGHSSWRQEVGWAYSSFALRTSRLRVLVVITTHATSSSSDFLELMSEMAKVSEVLFVGDEVHGLGAPEHRKGLLAEYANRLGLSATPERMFDERGTCFIREYFGDAKYEFTIKQAIDKDRVCPYKYYPIIVSLDDDECDRYDMLTEKIRKLSGPAERDPDAEEKLKNLLIERSLVISAAKGKIPILRDLVNENRGTWRDHILAFACHKNFNECLLALINGGVTTSPFTYKEHNRERILRKFESGDFEALLAMQCLDEGIDVPNAHVAILVSSTTNPREYIQRIGRVIRKAEGKVYARIYDFLVAPASETDDIILRDFERARYIASFAMNAFEAIEKLFPRFR